MINRGQVIIPVNYMHSRLRLIPVKLGSKMYKFTDFIRIISANGSLYQPHPLAAQVSHILNAHPMSHSQTSQVTRISTLHITPRYSVFFVHLMSCPYPRLGHGGS